MMMTKTTRPYLATHRQNDSVLVPPVTELSIMVKDIYLYIQVYTGIYLYVYSLRCYYFLRECKIAYTPGESSVRY